MGVVTQDKLESLPLWVLSSAAIGVQVGVLKFWGGVSEFTCLLPYRWSLTP